MTMLHDDMVRLRAPEPADLDTLYRWENDESLWRHSAVAAPVSRFLLSEYIKAYNPDVYAAGQLRFVIELVADGRPVGTVDISDFNARDRRAWVGIMVTASERDRGIGKRALALVGEYCRVTVGMHQLTAIVAVDNAASQALFTSAGYSTCGRLRSWMRVGHSYTDALVFQKIFA